MSVRIARACSLVTGGAVRLSRFSAALSCCSSSSDLEYREIA